ncbi:Transcriptional regulator GlxA family, contains an amidase domain and an AraC-type DNA-binding HTH domain [Ruegeria intermedia]|uniref:Transcriptional regulator GlxA family, contains an amidase domain and an AraC-type DNA-binding HTH domain n=1 Tax=Ruegeria intermedia TaxID=996115 RepID=A0A1M4ZLY3_9RHOB|nr:helix-turn-helix domain-containing protein [Ruegeria intermedia]SHF19100.1 Transcriptional regulator GlxA family, contains an amidase domain and an AraC-type DNA-binding HTH domain [Ruegeria intermedia]
MKHYDVLGSGAHLGSAPSSPERLHHVDVVLAAASARPSAQVLVEFFNALNELMDHHVYALKLRVIADGPAGGPQYWAGRTVVFWGDLHTSWRLAGPDRAWVSQAMNLASRAVLVSGAVLLLAEFGRAEDAVAAVHPNFRAAAQEVGLKDSATATYLSAAGRIHSATTPLSALRLLCALVSRDHGEHQADTLREYIGLEDPKGACTSRLASRLIRRSGADPVVCQAIEAMLDNVEDPLRISDLSESLGTSTRQLQRRFLSKTGEKLLTTYRELRLERAYHLLRHSDLPLREIAMATGFYSVTALGRAFRVSYDMRPDQVRNQRYAGQMSEPVPLKKAG